MPVWQDQNFSSVQRRSWIAASSLRSKIMTSPVKGNVRDPIGWNRACFALDPLERFGLG
jgi:hypothetical protein